MDLRKYLGATGLSGTVRDLWRQKDITPGDVMIAPHGVKLVKVR